MKKFLAAVLAALILSASAGASPESSPDSPYGPSQVRIVLKGLVCAYCAQGFERTLARHPEIESVRVRLGSHDAVIAFRAGASLSEAQLREAAEEAGLGVASVVADGVVRE